jgi:3-oxoacyl-ACP reductase-like protein
MSLFSSILSKLGFGSAQGATPAAATSGAPTPVAAAESPAAAPAAPTATPAAIPVVDVVGQLEALAAKNPEKLNWRVSIVDLMKLLGLDSSLTARKQLATELGCPADKMGDSAQMNMWLHQTVLQKLAANGGNVPKELLH